MKLIVACSLLWIGCSDVDDELDLGEIESAGTKYQGTRYQGTDYQGTRYQGTSYQGTRYQGTRYQSATYGGTTLSENVTISGTAISIWVTTSATSWERRYPDRICYYAPNPNNPNKRVQTGCTTVDLSTTPSPLTGTTFQGSFQRSDGTTFEGTITIGTSATQIGAVTSDTSLAMHPVGSSNLVFGSANGCDHSAGCAVNSDIWLYDLRLSDANGNALDFCSSTNNPATALSGVYDATGQRTNSTTQFTFACTSGTIAKCTRWGYRSFGSARKWAGASSPQNTSLYSMADHHQACVRAASADYCAMGVSFTKDNTIVDIWDYNPSRVNDYGFVPRTDGGTYSSSAVTALVWESGFDKHGATQIDRSRYQETQGGSIDATCPGKFVPGSDDVVCPLGSASCQYRASGWSGPVVWVDSAPACAHSELLTGKWLHDNCSTCTGKVKAALPYCTNPQDSRGWDASCVAKAKQLCTTSQRMATHSECTTGARLDMFDSGCTLAVCMNPVTSYCCAAGGTWDAGCTAAANSSACTFAKKSGCFGASCLLGLCASQPTTTGSNGL